MQITVGLTFPGTLQDESVICYLCKNFQITLNIIEASFSMSSGWAFLEIKGEKEEIKRTFGYLVSKGIKIQQLKTRS
jgi:ABC-type methionine transport system ATPase subunit